MVDTFIISYHHIELYRVESEMKLSPFLLCLFLALGTAVASNDDAGVVPSHSALCFLFVAMFSGAVIMLAMSRTGLSLPYTVIVFVFGILTSLVFQLVSENDTLKESIEIWNHFDPHLILYVFLPALLFGEAMHLNPHQFRSALSSSLLLAFPGAIFSAVVIAVAANYFLPYDWSWTLWFILGAILCTTDAVAVVPLLKKAGAPNRLGYVIVGESLFNDGTALVLYNLLYTTIAVAKHSEPTIASVTTYFLTVILMSPIVGVLFGICAIFLLNLASRRMEEDDSTVQIAVTLCCAYLSFFVGEEVLGVSGVISCVVAGIVLSNYAPPLILHRHTMHTVWSVVEWIGNTLIFVLAGLLVGSRGIQYMTRRDAVCILVTYLIVSTSRWLMMILFYPILSRVGNKCSVREAVFISWSGLRGAVSMAIALSLCHSVELGLTVVPSADANRVFLLVGGTATLTLVINAVLSDLVLTQLKLVDSDSGSNGKGGGRIMVQYVRALLFKKAKHLLDQACERRDTQHTSNNSSNSSSIINSCNRQLITNYCSILSSHPGGTHTEHAVPYGTMGHSPATESHSRESPLQARYPLSVPFAALTFNALTQSLDSCDIMLDDNTTTLPQVRVAFLELVRVHYWKQINCGTLPRQSSATRALLHSVDAALESPQSVSSVTSGGCMMSDWSVLLITCKSLRGSGDDDSGDNKDHSNASNTISKTNGSNSGYTKCATKSRGVFETMRLATKEHEHHRLSTTSIDISPYIPQYRLRDKTDQTNKTTAGNNTMMTRTDVVPEGSTESATKEGEDGGDVENPLANLTGKSRFHHWRQHAQRDMSLSLVTQPHDDDSECSAVVNSQRQRQRGPSETIRLRAFCDWLSGDCLSEYHTAKKVHILTAFIAAHEYAEAKMQRLLGRSAEGAAHCAQLIVENQRVLSEARRKLAGIDTNTVTLHVSKQTARWILHSQEDSIAGFQKQGILTEKESFLMLDEVRRDIDRIGSTEWSSILIAKLLHRVHSCLCGICHGCHCTPTTAAMTVGIAGDCTCGDGNNDVCSVEGGLELLSNVSAGSPYSNASGTSTTAAAAAAAEDEEDRRYKLDV